MRLSYVASSLRFFIALAVALLFYSRMDILIWQRIFETHALGAIGVGVYHWGWVHALFGFGALGALLYYPDVRRMITYPLSLGLLVFSGLEDILYYWLDGRALPGKLPWLTQNPLILKPVTNETLIASAGFWIAVVLAAELVGFYLDHRRAVRRALVQPQLVTAE
jgi:hypothetical protein